MDSSTSLAEILRLLQGIEGRLARLEIANEPGDPKPPAAIHTGSARWHQAFLCTQHRNKTLGYLATAIGL
jgi:hypothetical protein